MGLNRHHGSNYALHTTAKPLHGLASLAALGASNARDVGLPEPEAPRGTSEGAIRHGPLLDPPRHCPIGVEVHCSQFTVPLIVEEGVQSRVNEGGKRTFAANANSDRQCAKADLHRSIIPN